MTADPDVLVVGGGHNGLVAAILAAPGRPAGHRCWTGAAHLGGATVGEPLFPPHPARLSRYSYLVVAHARGPGSAAGHPARHWRPGRSRRSRRCVAAGGRRACWWSAEPGAATEQSFVDVTGSTADLVAWRQFYGEMAAFAGAAAPAF